MIETLHIHIGSPQPKKESNTLKDITFGSPLLFHLQGGPGGSLEYFPDTLLALGAALQVGEGVNLLGHGVTLFMRYGLLVHPTQRIEGVWIVSKILKVG